MRQTRGLTLLEVIVVIVVIAITASIVFPILKANRPTGRRTQCASNVRQLLTAMYLYSDSPSNGGTMPTTSTSKDDPFAQSQPASEALNLLYRQYVSDPRIFACPTDPTRPSPQVLQQIKGWPTDGSRLVAPMTPALTSYAYDPGHSTNISSMVALLADKPGKRLNSDNHGPNAGQNVGFGTSVEFRETVTNPLDAGVIDPDIYGLNTELRITILRDDDSYIRQ